MTSTSKSSSSTHSAASSRGHWGSNFEFILSAVGCCVGFGNVWRFPYKVFQNGGGAFLIPYFVMLILVGLPMYFMEQALAQFSSLGPVSLWKFCPLFKGIGYSMFIMNALFSIYYNMLLGWVIYFLIHSFTPTSLPWSGCDNSWNSQYCSHPITQCREKNGQFDGFVCRTDVSPSESRSSNHLFQPNDNWTSPAEEFWINNVLRRSPGIDQVGSFLLPQYAAFVMSQAIIYLILIKGVKSVGKVVYVTVIAPYVILLILLIRGLTLPGMEEGVKFFIQPDFSRLADLTVWTGAANQIIFSLALGCGINQTLSSFKRFNVDCERDTFIVAVTNCGTSIFAGFTVFSILGFLANQQETSVPDAVQDGMGLAFVAYPSATVQMPFSPLWAVLFFLMMLNVGVDSVFAGLEANITNILDEVPALKPHRKYITLGVILTSTLMSLPICTESGFYWFFLLDWYVALYPIFLIQSLQSMLVAYVYGVKRFSLDIQTMTGKPVNIYWKKYFLYRPMQSTKCGLRKENQCGAEL
ncbi:sodium- and chloride-dependent glycine transporter 2-like isoform X2 [Symsagittifera roscoffensis]|uniref:sodium- and chloride-dependent glycine transporter 2-like isoform X2 n=1 Tax=Symsagittifera roscoffensis TaxID=84072 RepID=UPI00307B4F8B